MSVDYHTDPLDAAMLAGWEIKILPAAMFSNAAYCALAQRPTPHVVVWAYANLPGEAIRKLLRRLELPTEPRP